MVKKILLLLAIFVLTNALPETVPAQKPKPSGKTALTNSKSTKSAPGDEKQKFKKAFELTDLNSKIAALQKFVTGFPKSAEKTRALEIIVSSRAQLADEKLQAGEIETGVELFKLAVREAPVPVSEKLFAGVVAQFPTNLFYRGQQKAAVEVARLIEEKIGGDANRLLVLARFYLGTENAAEARRLAEKAIAVDAALPAAHQALGLARRLNFELEESAAAYAKALELDPNSAVSKRNLAEMKRALGKADEAERLYRELLEKDAADAAAQTGLTLSLFDAGKQAEAETELNKALATNPNNLALLVGAAYWYAAQRDGAKAVEFASRATAIEPRYTWAQIALARGLILQKRPLEAEKTLLLARQYGNFPTLDYELAAARLAAGLYEEAARELKRSFALKNGVLETKLAGRVPKQADDFIVLLELERRASIFEPQAADIPEDAEKLKSLLNLQQRLAVANVGEDELNRAVDEFVGGDDKAVVYRRIYAASRLVQNKKALPKAIELARAASGGVDSAMDVPHPAAAVLADELVESRQIAISKGEVLVVPEIPRQTLLAILRGRIEEINGWALYQQEKLPEAATRLRRAVSVLPEKSAWWRSSQWRLGVVLDANGQSKEALDAYIKSYNGGAPDPIRRSVIEAVYQKVNGNLDGLDARIGAKPPTEPSPAVPNQTLAQTTVSPAPPPAASPTPQPETISEAKPENPPATVITTDAKAATDKKPSGEAEKSSSKPLFDPVVITVPKTEVMKSEDESAETKKPADAENPPCLGVSQETISILSRGGSLGVLVGFQTEGDLTKITAVSSSPDDVTLTPDDEIGKQSNRLFFVIKSVSEKKGIYTVTFAAPCGKKEIQVKVR